MANTPRAATGTDIQGTQNVPTEDKVKTAEERVKETGEAVFFEGTIAKIDKDGNEVMSDHLAPGEKLKSETTQAYATVQHSERKEANADQRRKDALDEADRAKAESDLAQQRAAAKADAEKK